MPRAKGKKDSGMSTADVSRMMRDLMTAPAQLDEALCMIADLLHRLGGDVALNVFDGQRIRQEYTLGIERNTDHPELIRLRLYARPRDSRTSERENEPEHKEGAGA